MSKTPFHTPLALEARYQGELFCYYPAFGRITGFVSPNAQAYALQPARVLWKPFASRKRALRIAQLMAEHDHDRDNAFVAALHREKSNREKREIKSHERFLIRHAAEVKALQQSENK